MSELNILLKQLDEAAKNPAAQLDKVLASGKKAIGCVPVYCPEELVYAAGMIPFGVWGADGVELKNSKLYFPAFICSVMQSALELGMAGTFDKLSGIMIPVLCDSLKCMTQNFRCAVPQVEVLPVIHPQNRRIEAGQEFLRSQYAKLKNRLGEISGIEATDERINAAIDVYNAHRAAMRAFTDNCAEHPELVSPAARSAVIQSGFFMDKAEHTAIVNEINVLLAAAPASDKKFKRIIVTGILADSPAILAAFERFGSPSLATTLPLNPASSAPMSPQEAIPLRDLRSSLPTWRAAAFSTIRKRSAPSLLPSLRRSGRPTAL